METEKEIVALYTRVSTEIQVNDGNGLVAQRKRLDEHCNYKRYKVYKLYCDEAKSGKETSKRTQYNKMLADMKAKKFTKIVAHKLDRISRSVKDFALLMEELKKYNCEIEFIDGPIDVSGASGKMVATILSAFAEFERNMIVDRTTYGMEEAAYNGHFGGKTPLGYMRKIVNGEKTKEWVINKEEEKVVKEIFNLCLKGKTYAKIANEMKEKYGDMVAYVKEDKETGEVIKVKYRNWTDSAICVILNNKTYLGIREFRKRVKDKDVIEITGKIPPIISEEVFNECRENIERNRRNYYREKHYLFMQKLTCPKCDRIMACNGTRKKPGKNYLYYKCKNCKTYFREDLVEKELVYKLTTLLELYLVLEDNYVVVDKDMAEELNKGRTDNSVRYALDTLALERKKSCINYDFMQQLWCLTSYETRCKFIYEYIDTIKVKQYKKNNIVTLELLDLKLKPHKIEDFFKMKEKNMLDGLAIDYEEYKFRGCTFSSKKQADEYIETLRKKYDIRVIDLLEVGTYDITQNLFRIINISSKRAVEKDRLLLLELAT